MVNSKATENTAILKEPLQKNGKKLVPFISPKVFEDASSLNESNDTSIDLGEFEQYRVTKEKEVPKTKPIALIGESPILAPGNITPTTAEGKAGKTALKNKIIGGAISKIGNAELFTGLTVEPNREGRAVIDFDTEQSEDDQQYNLNKTLECAGLKSTPDYYLSYNIRTVALVDYQNVTNRICEAANRKFGGIYLIVVDGAADYITSVNDEAEANAIIAYFISLAVKYHCPILLVIHLNENAGRNGDTMPRGHIGRQAIRKGYCQLNITKEGDISTLQVLRARKAGNDTPLICFKYDKDKGYHVSVDADDVSNAKQIEKEQAKRRLAEKMAKKLFPVPKAFRNTDVITALMDETSKSKPTAKRLLDDLQGWGILNKGEDGLYRLSI